MLRNLAIFVVPLVAVAVLLAGSDGVIESQRTASYLVVGSEGCPGDQIVQDLLSAGADEVRSLDAIGVYVASSKRPDFLAAVGELTGVDGVARNLRNVRIAGANSDYGLAIAGPKVDPSSHGDGDFIFGLQWALDAIDAHEAWHAGALGTGVRVAVLDTGIDVTHPDLTANINVVLSKSFVPGETFVVAPGTWFPGAHGTHVAGTIAAADNDLGIIGVAPEAEIVAVKVLSSVDGYGTWDGVFEGMVYAADIGADVINLSLGGYLNRRGGYDDNGTADPSDDFWLSANEVSAIVNATARAAAYATRKGTLVVAAAGNDAIDADHAKDFINLPGGVPHVINVSATGPIGWFNDPTTDLDLLAVYSNFGQSEIDLAAPGGNADLTFPANWHYDMVISTVPGTWAWAAGTSMATPHVVGVAALIIGENGGSMKPSAVERVLRKSADDLGKPGRDDAYGHGRINAYNAVK